MGADIVVITDGSNGSYATNGGSAWTCPVFPVKAVERTGAGDGFATAFMVALHEGCDIPDALRYGSANSASVVQFVGPQAGLLTKKQMRASLKTFAKIKPKHLLYARIRSFIIATRTPREVRRARVQYQ
jgi:5-dehydro-2-deoxygluconokinase